MRPLSRDEIRRIDKTAIEAVGVPGVVLMENAGRNAADAVERFIGGAAGKALAVMAGSGNNAGDGFVVARHLAMRGAKMVSFLVGEPQKLTDDARVNLEIIRALGQEIRQVRQGGLEQLSAALQGFDLVIDAIGGTGISGALRGAAATAVEQINQAGKPVVAIDIPTGLDCDTGLAEGPAVKADLTITFIARKKGYDEPSSAQYTGQVIVADIGIPPEVVLRIAGQ